MRIYLKKKQAHLRTAFLLQGWKCAPSCAWIQISLCQFVEVMMANVQYSLFSQWRWVHIKILVDWPNLKVINFNLWLNPSITFWVIQPSKQPTHTHNVLGGGSYSHVPVMFFCEWDLPASRKKMMFFHFKLSVNSSFQPTNVQIFKVAVPLVATWGLLQKWAFSHWLLF